MVLIQKQCYIGVGLSVLQQVVLFQGGLKKRVLLSRLCNLTMHPGFLTFCNTSVFQKKKKKVFQREGQ